MYFEISARSGTNIILTFNEVAKKLTGIETNPIGTSEVKNTAASGFNLNQINNNPNSLPNNTGG